MFDAPRNSGIPLIGELPWGSHFCQFYRTDDDLLDILLPYLATGLAGNELCLWVVPAERTGEEAGTVVSRARASLGKQIDTGHMTVMTCREWQSLEVEAGNALFALLDRAVMGGFDGLRIACTLSSTDMGDDFAICQAIGIIGGVNALALVSYPHDQFDAPGLMEVIKNHRCALLRKPGGWDLIQSSEARGVRDELKRSVEKLNFLYSNMSEGFAYHRIVLDAERKPCDYVFMEVNEAFEALTGLRGADIVGKRVTDVIPGIETDPSDWIGRYGAVALTGEPLRFESYSVPLGKWFEVTAFSPHKGYFAVMFSDITGRKLMQEALESTARKYSAMFDTTTDGVWLHDLHGAILEVNDAYCRLSGYCRDELIGMPIRVLEANETADEIAVHIRKIIAAGGHDRFESRHRRKDGSLLDVDITALHLEIEDGRIAIFVRDITPRKRAEETLRESEERVRRKLDSILSPEGNLENLELADIVDAKSFQALVNNFYKLTRLPMGLIDINGKVLVGVGWQDICTKFHRVNPLSCANCIESDVLLSAGVPVGECKVYKCKNNMWDVATPIIVGEKHFGNLFMGQFFFEDEPIDYEFFRHQARTFGFNEQDYLAALEMVPRMGREALATSMAFSMKLADILSRLGYSNLKLARSLSERDALMEELRQSKEMAEAATRTKSQFLANMSHELRTPMTGVLGMLEFALGGRLDDRQREYLEIAHRSARSLLRILNDILDLTKVEAGKMAIEEHPFDLRACVNGALDIIIPEMRRKGLALVHSVADTVPACIVGDQTRLMQVLTNVCGNAVKFTEQGKVEVSVVPGDTLPDGRREIIFTVADTGIGIPDDKKGALFQPFSQIDDSDTRKYGGTGLGLAISREFVTAMGGSISFARSDRGGSVFSFTVPFRESDAIPLSSEPSPALVPPDAGIAPTPGKRPYILLAEDDPTTRQVLGELLSRLDFDLDIAENGLQVIEMWEKGAYDLVLMDVQMPRLDGFAATRAIRERELTKGGHTIIVAMTAHAFEEDKERCRQAGMDSYISKPIDLRQCIATFNSLLNRGTR